MKTKNITPRTTLNRRNLFGYIADFLKQTNFRSQYIFIQVKLLINQGNKTRPLCNKILLDLKDRALVRSFKEVVSHNFDDLTNKKRIINVEKVFIVYIETNEETYDNYINKLSKGKDFELEYADNSN
uniref:hypothetical protein n=1 Tax=Porodaedalea mongolica TaxID=2651638 RepID=UPI0021AC3D01|nr:hypothetical protein NYK79_mgp54 [Porodaedalea mongolica]UUA03936.1 hypothetical protein [Porodaedalea mongolica]WCF76696.1 hypothetical protein [Porodaedalea mongolica]